MKVSRNALVLFSFSFSFFYGAGLLAAVFPGNSFGVLQVICALLVVVASIIYFMRHGFPALRILSVFGYILLLILLSFIPNFDPKVSQNMVKWGTFFAVFGLMSVAGVFLGRIDDKGIFAKIFSYSLLVISVGVAIVARESILVGRLHSDAGNPIWIARAASIPVLYVLYKSIFSKASFIEMCCGLLAFGIVALTGSRGPAFSLVMVGILWMLIRVGPGKMVQMILKVFGFVIAFCVVLVIVPHDLILRFMAAFNGSSDGTVGIREDLWHRAVILINRNPLGWGMGGYQAQTGLPSSLGYPHNIVLETLVEPGTVFALFFLSFLLIGLLIGLRVASRNKSSNPVLTFYFGLMLFSFFNSLVSGDLTSPKILYLFATMFVFGLSKRKPDNRSV